MTATIYLLVVQIPLEDMGNCARCGSAGASEPEMDPFEIPSSDYEYCHDCQSEFSEIYHNGVVVESNHGKQYFREFPYSVVDNKPTAVEPRKRDPQTQVEALADGMRIMDEAEVPGLFIYRKTGSIWLVGEYLDAHPPIATDVHKENQSLLDRLPF